MYRLARDTYTALQAQLGDKKYFFGEKYALNVVRCNTFFLIEFFFID